MAIFIAGVIMSFGCAGQKAAQQTARVLVGQTLTMEQDINQKIAAETQFVTNSTQLLQEAAERESFTSEQLQLSVSASAFASQTINSSKTITGDDIAAFLISETEKTWATSSNVLAQANADIDSLNSTIQQLNAKMTQLKSVRTTLESLQMDTGLFAHGQELLSFVNQVKSGVTNQATKK